MGPVLTNLIMNTRHRGGSSSSQGAAPQHSINIQEPGHGDEDLGPWAFDWGLTITTTGEKQTKTKTWELSCEFWNTKHHTPCLFRAPISNCTYLISPFILPWNHLELLSIFSAALTFHFNHIHPPNIPTVACIWTWVKSLNNCVWYHRHH